MRADDITMVELYHVAKARERRRNRAVVGAFGERAKFLEVCKCSAVATGEGLQGRQPPQRAQLIVGISDPTGYPDTLQTSGFRFRIKSSRRIEASGVRGRQLHLHHRIAVGIVFDASSASRMHAPGFTCGREFVPKRDRRASEPQSGFGSTSFPESPVDRLSQIIRMAAERRHPVLPRTPVALRLCPLEQLLQIIGMRFAGSSALAREPQSFSGIAPGRIEQPVIQAVVGKRLGDERL